MTGRFRARWRCGTFALLSLTRVFSPSASCAGPPRVVTTVAPQAWLVERIVDQPGYTVESLVRPDDSPETFQPTDAQITRLSRADLFFRIGVPGENASWFRAIEDAGQPVVVDLRTGLDLRHLEHHHPHHGDSHAESESLDPHIWLSPARLRIMAETVAGALAAVDPAHAPSYTANAENLKRELDALESELRSELAALEGWAFFVLHPAWGYFADDFGLRQVAVEIEGKNPSDVDVTRFIAEAGGLEAHALFVQPQFYGHTARAVADSLGARVVVLDPLADDVPSNLRHTARQLRAAWAEENGPN